MNTGARLRSVTTALLLASAAAGPVGATPPPRIDATLTASLGHDDNLYGIDSGRLAKIESATASAAARLSAAPAPGLLLAYAPSATRHFDASTEDFVKHVLSASWKARAEALSWRASTDFTRVSGDERGADYGPGCGSAFSTALPRERREQFQNKSELTLRHDSSLGFVRGLGRLAYWDMLTAPAGGANYVDRHDIQGGLDLGRALREGGPELFLGYRRGYQFQDRDAAPGSPSQASNHYDRYVLGGEGRLAPGLRLAGEAGWARHAYPGDPAVYAGSAHEEGLFTDLALTWTPTAADELQLKTSQSRTISTTGTNAYLLSLHQLAWKHVFSPETSATLTGRVSEAEYSPAARDDMLYGLAASLTHAFDQRWSATAAVDHQSGREHHNAVSGGSAAQREFDRTLVTLSVAWKL